MRLEGYVHQQLVQFNNRSLDGIISYKKIVILELKLKFREDDSKYKIIDSFRTKKFPLGLMKMDIANENFPRWRTKARIWWN